jgi:glycosyltransferase involved in cell wall biosynthesis
MKVLHVIDSGGMYGAEVMLLNLVIEQVRLGLEPAIASIGEPHIAEKPLETEAVRRGIRVAKFRMRPGPNISGALEILGFARSEKFDLLHSHGYKGDILLGMVPRAIRKIPVVATLHGRTSMGKMNKMRLYEWVDSLSLRYIESAVLVNDAMRVKIRHHNLHVVNNGIPMKEDIQNDSPEAGGTPLDYEIVDFCREGFTIGAIGRLSEEKGFGLLLEALKMVSETYHDVRLVIIGEGGQRKNLEAIVKKLELCDKVLLSGYRDRASRYISYFDLFVLSSLTEGLPIALLEAMQAGVPIVATRVGGVPEVLENGEAGILVDSSDPVALSEGIMKLIKTPVFRSSLVEKARNVVREKYSSNRMAVEYKKIYCDLLTSSKGYIGERSV